MQDNSTKLFNLSSKTVIIQKDIPDSHVINFSIVLLENIQVKFFIV